MFDIFPFYKTTPMEKIIIAQTMQRFLQLKGACSVPSIKIHDTYEVEDLFNPKVDDHKVISLLETFEI